MKKTFFQSFGVSFLCSLVGFSAVGQSLSVKAVVIPGESAFVAAATVVNDIYVPADLLAKIKLLMSSYGQPLLEHQSVTIDLSTGKILAFPLKHGTDGHESDIDATSRLIFPTTGRVTQGFHVGHYAIDVTNIPDTNVWAAADGVVTKVVNHCTLAGHRCGGGYGNMVILRHPNGLETLYAHLNSVKVAVGDHVSQGTSIGLMGSTGNVYGENRNHLHFEVRLNDANGENGKKKNPAIYLKFLN